MLQCGVARLPRIGSRRLNRIVQARSKSHWRYFGGLRASSLCSILRITAFFRLSSSCTIVAWMGATTLYHKSVSPLLGKTNVENRTGPGGLRTRETLIALLPFASWCSTECTIELGAYANETCCVHRTSKYHLRYLGKGAIYVTWKTDCPSPTEENEVCR